MQIKWNVQKIREKFYLRCKLIGASAVPVFITTGVADYTWRSSVANLGHIFLRNLENTSRNFFTILRKTSPALMSILKKIAFSAQFLEIISTKSLVADSRRQTERRAWSPQKAPFCFF
jgi:hypothetical protein